MKFIKKIQVTPLPKNKGKIIDSFDSSDDKHSNAPSLHAVDDNFVRKEYAWATYKQKDDIVVIRGEIDVSDGNGKTNVDYPENFNMNNCVVLGVGISFSENVSNALIFGTQNDRSTGAYLLADKIQVSTQSNNNTGPTGTLRYKLVLMKV